MLVAASLTLFSILLARAEESPTKTTEHASDQELEGHEHKHELEGEVGGQVVRFSHPLTFISPTPETLLRVDHLYQRIHDSEDKARENEIRFTAEYAFHASFSMEVEAPYVFRDPDEGSSESNFGAVKIGAHFANLEFVHRGLVVGYGLEMVLPTGDDDKEIDSDHIVETNPFVSLGYLKGNFEIASVMLFTIPSNLDSEESVENELQYDLGVHYWVSPTLIGFAELNGSTVMNGDESGRTVIGFNPGIKLRPFAAPVELAVGVGFPLTGREEYEMRTFFSLFYFF